MRTFCGEMNELASKLFKTFFRSKKSFQSSELEFVEVSSKTENFRNLGWILDAKISKIWNPCSNGFSAASKSAQPNFHVIRLCNFFPIATAFFDFIFGTYIYMTIGVLCSKIRIFVKNKHFYMFSIDFTTLGVKNCQFPCCAQHKAVMHQKITRFHLNLDQNLSKNIEKNNNV